MSPDALTKPLLQSAARMAAAGRYEAAVSLIDTLDGDEPELDALLLKAKILAQQGRYQQAIGLWKEVLQRQPENREARAGVRRAEKITKSSLGRFYQYSASCYATVIVAVTAAGAVIVAILLGVPSLGAGRRSAAHGTAFPPVNAQLPSVSLQEMERGIRSGLAEAAALREDAEQRLQSLEHGLDDLESALREHSSSLEQRVAEVSTELERQLAGDGELASRPSGLDGMAERLTVVEIRLSDYDRRLDQALGSFQKSADRAYQRQLIAAAVELSHRQSLTGNDLESVTYLAQELLELGYDESSQDYARRLIEWVNRRQQRGER